MNVPEVLQYATVVRYTCSNAGVAKLKNEIADILRAILSPTKLAEAKTLCRLKLFEAALIAASNHLYDFLRQSAAAKLGRVLN
jgi:hypothetical protein